MVMNADSPSESDASIVVTGRSSRDLGVNRMLLRQSFLRFSDNWTQHSFVRIYVLNLESQHSTSFLERGCVS